MDYEKVSTTHLENSQKLVDEMTMLASRMHGMVEAMGFMLPDQITASDSYYRLRQALQNYVGGGVPIAIWLKGWSEEMQKELEKRKK